MPGLAETLKELANRTVAGMNAPTAPGRLELREVAPNPGRLRMWQYRPAGLAPDAALVVALHGCGQNAAAYDAGTGWSTLADRLGFALLCPEQSTDNNQQGCFNWFERPDVSRETGEAASIVAMVRRMLAEGGLDRTRVYVTGLSAGGAMTAALLAAYPDVFAAGAVIAGLPAGSATTMSAALDAMFRGHVETGPEWGRRVRDAGPAGFAGPWPRVSVWHGTADHTVRPINAGEAVKQWLDVHGLSGAGSAETMEGASCTVWRDAAGRAMVEQVMVPGLGHGVPVAPGHSGVGAAGAHFMTAAVSATEEIARFFGLQPAVARAAAPPEPEQEESLVARLLRTGLDPLKVGPLKVGPLKVGPLAIGPLKVGPFRLGPFRPS